MAPGIAVDMPREVGCRRMRATRTSDLDNFATVHSGSPEAQGVGFAFFVIQFSRVNSVESRASKCKQYARRI